MLKAILLDLDDTLCDTRGANAKAEFLMAQALLDRFWNWYDCLFYAIRCPTINRYGYRDFSRGAIRLLNLRRFF